VQADRHVEGDLIAQSRELLLVDRTRSPRTPEPLALLFDQLSITTNLSCPALARAGLFIGALKQSVAQEADQPRVAPRDLLGGEERRPRIRSPISADAK